jgi:hypothetical protein
MNAGEENHKFSALKVCDDTLKIFRARDIDRFLITNGLYWPFFLKSPYTTSKTKRLAPWMGTGPIVIARKLVGLLETDFDVDPSVLHSPLFRFISRNGFRLTTAHGANAIGF